MKPFALSLLLLAPLAAAQQQSLALNPAASSVAFALTGTGHEVHGTFRIASGSVRLDPAAHTLAGSIVVTALSGDSGDKGRDKKMHTDVLDADRFAEITFQPQSYSGTLAPSGDSTLQVSGIFTLHGAPHPITVPMQVHIEGSALSATGTFLVPYVQWGLKDPSIFILKVAKQVRIDLHLAGTLQPAG